MIIQAHILTKWKPGAWGMQLSRLKGCLDLHGCSVEKKTEVDCMKKTARPLKGMRHARILIGSRLVVGLVGRLAGAWSPLGAYAPIPPTFRSKGTKYELVLQRADSRNYNNCGCCLAPSLLNARASGCAFRLWNSDKTCDELLGEARRGNQKQKQTAQSNSPHNYPVFMAQFC